MHPKPQHPSWWLLYLSLPAMIGLFWLERHLSLPETGLRLAELIIFLVVFGGIWLWLKANTGALIQEDLEIWQAERMMSEQNPAREITVPDQDVNPQPHQAWESMYHRLAGWASAISGFLH